MPPVVWAVLILAGLRVIGYICFYADPAEPVLVQAFMMTTVTTMVVSGLLVVRISDVRTRRAAAAYGPWPWRVRVIESMELAHQGEGAAVVPCGAKV